MQLLLCARFVQPLSRKACLTQQLRTKIIYLNNRPLQLNTSALSEAALLHAEMVCVWRPATDQHLGDYLPKLPEADGAREPRERASRTFAPPP
jgi:hypothetical protein